VDVQLSPSGNALRDLVDGDMRIVIADFNRRPTVKAGGSKYTVEAAIPFTAIGFTPSRGAKLTGDVGFMSSDADGKVNVARTYWSNKHTNLVNDEPHEAWLYPHEWGRITFE